MKVLVSNIMMLKEKVRFEKALQNKGLTCDFPNVEQFLKEEDLLDLVGSYDAWLAGDDEITEKVLQKALPKLKVISKWGTGIDSIDKEACKKHGVKLFNSPGAFRDAVSEVAMGYIVDLARKITFTDRMVRQGQWPKPVCEGLRNKNLGIIGFGAIGQGLAEKAQGFRMNVLACDPFFKQEADPSCKKVSLAELLEHSDYIALACNLAKENYHLLNEAAFRSMKKGVYIINVARGPLIDETALEAALNSGKVAGAALDVFESEPPHHSKLTHMDQVILGSHNANNTKEAIETVHANTLNNMYSELGI